MRRKAGLAQEIGWRQTTLASVGLTQERAEIAETVFGQSFAEETEPNRWPRLLDATVATGAADTKEVLEWLQGAAQNGAVTAIDGESLAHHAKVTRITKQLRSEPEAGYSG